MQNHSVCIRNPKSAIDQWCSTLIEQFHAIAIAMSGGSDRRVEISTESPKSPQLPHTLSIANASVISQKQYLKTGSVICMLSFSSLSLSLAFEEFRLSVQLTYQEIPFHLYFFFPPRFVFSERNTERTRTLATRSNKRTTFFGYFSW